MTGLNVWILGRKYWILIWYGILILGVTGLFGALYWGSRTRWRNMDEVLRAAGTAVVSVGMLLVLHRVGNTAAQVLLVVALLLFVLAFVLGRRPDAFGNRRAPTEDDEDSEDETPPPADRDENS